MKRFLFLLAVVLTVSVAKAADLVYIRSGQPESKYTITQSSEIIVSTAFSTVTACSGYRVICIHNLSSSTSVYYRLDGSSSNIARTGWAIPPNGSDEIETNGVVYLRTNSGSAGIKKKIIQK